MITLTLVMTTTPEPLTLNPTFSTPRYDLSPWTVDLLVDGYDSRWPGGPHEMPARCESCGARGEELLFFGHGDWQCGACAASCEYCDERAAVVSARRSTAPIQIDHVCVECLVEHWAPGETLLSPGPAKSSGAPEADRRVA